MLPGRDRNVRERPVIRAGLKKTDVEDGVPVIRREDQGPSVALRIAQSSSELLKTRILARDNEPRVRGVDLDLEAPSDLANPV